MGKFGNIKSLSDIAGEQEQDKLQKDLEFYEKKLEDTQREIMFNHRLIILIQSKITETKEKLGGS